VNNIFRVDQIAQGCVQMYWVSKDIKRTMKFFRSRFGAAPFQLVRDFPVEDRVYRRRPRTFRLDRARLCREHAEQGDSPTVGPIVFSEFFETRGEGLHHVGFLVKPHEYADAVEAITRNGSQLTPGRRFPSVNFRNLIS
jgi:hypothetical protein